jgi:gluconolactonase
MITRRSAVVTAASAAALSNVPMAFAAAAQPPVQTTVKNFKLLAHGLRFTEAPVAMPDGSVFFVEIPAGHIDRVKADGTFEVFLQANDGPNGLSIGPDGALYVARAGNRSGPPVNPPPTGPEHHGSIARVDIATRDMKILYTQCEGKDLGRCDDLTFDEWGDMWVTDLGANCLYNARADGSAIKVAAGGLTQANGIGLSPDRRTIYVALTRARQLVAFTITGRGTLAMDGDKVRARILATVPGDDLHFDSLCVEADGSVLVCNVGQGLCRFAPDGTLIEQINFDNYWPINLVFGGADLKTLYVVGYPAGQKPGMQDGQLISLRWPRPGLKLLYRKYA